MALYAYVIFLGILQGVTEFLPVSSSGHLFLVEQLPFARQMSADLAGRISLLAFNVFLHLGTLAAVILYYREDLIILVKNILSDLKKGDWQGAGMRKLRLAFFALLPLVAVPFYKDRVEHAGEQLHVLGILFICNGILLALADYLVLRFKKVPVQYDDFSRMAWWRGLIIGLFQCVAVFPGISRSGSTISAGLFQGLSSSESVRFSFLISIPVMLAAGLLEGKKAFSQPTAIPTGIVITGMITAFLSGFLSLRMLVWLAKKMIFYPFAIYTLILGMILLFL